MSDLISRQAAIEAAMEELESGTYFDIPSKIKGLPSVQPEIIRCKDCKHDYDCNIQYHAQAGKEFYCGAAERRTDDADVNT